MRPFSLITTALMALNPEAADWKEYPQPQLGFVVEFPANPVASRGSYRTALIPSATAHIFSVKGKRTVYVATAVDLDDRREEGSMLLGEAESMLMRLGDVTSVCVSRVETGAAPVYGRSITIRFGQTAEASRAWFRNITGAECVDRSRLATNLFFYRGRLYLIQGISFGEDSASSAVALRFANSINFLAADGSRERNLS